MKGQIRFGGVCIVHVHENYAVDPIRKVIVYEAEIFPSKKRQKMGRGFFWVKQHLHKYAGS